MAFPGYNWAVSTGRPGYDTPTGDFQAFRMEKDHFSKEWDDAPMPYSIFFTEQGHAIHGSYQTKRLGSAVSHGCVRIAPGNAAKLFALVQAEGLANTEVVVAGSDSGYLDLGSTVGPETAHPGAVLGPAWSKYYDPGIQSPAEPLQRQPDLVEGRRARLRLFRCVDFPDFRAGSSRTRRWSPRPCSTVFRFLRGIEDRLRRARR